MAQMQAYPFGALKDKIRITYKAEKAEDALEITETADSLTVKIAYCPGVKHLRATGREVTEWFSLTTSVVMETLAEAGGLSFQLEHYNSDTGAAQYRFTK